MYGWVVRKRVVIIIFIIKSCTFPLSNNLKKKIVSVHPINPTTIANILSMSNLLPLTNPARNLPPPNDTKNSLARISTAPPSVPSEPHIKITGELNSTETNTEIAVQASESTTKIHSTNLLLESSYKNVCRFSEKNRCLTLLNTRK